MPFNPKYRKMIQFYSFIFTLLSLMVTAFPFPEKTIFCVWQVDGIIPKNETDSIEAKLRQVDCEKSKKIFSNIGETLPASPVTKNLLEAGNEFFQILVTNVSNGVELVYFYGERQLGIRRENCFVNKPHEPTVSQNNQKPLLISSKYLAAAIEGEFDASNLTIRGEFFPQIEAVWWMISICIVLVNLLGTFLLFALWRSTRGFLYEPGGRRRINKLSAYSLIVGRGKVAKDRDFGSSLRGEGSWDGGGASGRW